MPISKKRKKTAIHDAHEKQLNQEPVNLDSPASTRPDDQRRRSQPALCVNAPGSDTR